MESIRTVTTVETHTEGMPTRVVTSGIGEIPGATMFDKRLHFMEHMDFWRQWLMFEPRGHSAMSGAILQKPTRPDADWGVVYIEVSGCLPMCGHGTIGVATALVEKKLVKVVEPVTTIRLDTPAGLVVVEVAVENGRAKSVTMTNVTSFCLALDQKVNVPGFGELTYDIAYGGNFYAIVPVERVGWNSSARMDRSSLIWVLRFQMQSMSRIVRSILRIQISQSVITSISFRLEVKGRCIGRMRWLFIPDGSIDHHAELAQVRGWRRWLRAGNLEIQMF